MAENILDVTENDFEDMVIKSNIPVLVDFWAVWCGPCRMIEPSLDNIAVNNKEKLKVVKINVDQSPSISAKYGVMSIPTVLLFKDGEVKVTIVGALPQQKIEKKIEKYLI